MAGEIELLAPASSMALNLAFSMEERNRLAREAIKSTAADHAKWDILVGSAGMFGLALPALAVAIATQGPMFYKPLARKLAHIYGAEPDQVSRAIEKENLLFTGVADVANELGTEFLMMIAGDLVLELGLGAAATFIPGVGAVVGAALDYIVATTMTWRIGVMVSIYYQNGGEWVGDKKHTFELAKQMTGGLGSGLSDLLSKFGSSNKPTLDVDLNSIPRRVPQVGRWQVENLKPIVLMALEMGGADLVRAQLRKRGIPAELIEKALSYATQV